MKMLPLVVLIAATSFARADGLDAGLWRLINLTTVNGRDVPPAQSMRCLRPEEVADLDHTFRPVFGTVNSDCEQTEHEASTQRVKWRLVCKGQMNMEVAAEFVFETRERYVAVMTTHAQMAAGGPAQRQHTVIEATRVGECK